MKKLFFLIVSAVCLTSCCQAPKYSNRAEAIATQMHDPHSKYVVVAAHEAKYPHNMMYMPIVDIQKEKGIALFNSYLEQGVVPLAYEICWQRGRCIPGGMCENPGSGIEDMGQHHLGLSLRR